MKRATVGPLPGVTQDIAGFKVIFFPLDFLLASLYVKNWSVDRLVLMLIVGMPVTFKLGKKLGRKTINSVGGLFSTDNYWMWSKLLMR